MNIGDEVWVDEGDGPGCVEYRGIVESIAANGDLLIRVNSHPIGPGAETGSLRRADPNLVFEVNGQDA